MIGGTSLIVSQPSFSNELKHSFLYRQNQIFRHLIVRYDFQGKVSRLRKSYGLIFPSKSNIRESAIDYEIPSLDRIHRLKLLTAIYMNRFYCIVRIVETLINEIAHKLGEIVHTSMNFPILIL